MKPVLTPVYLVGSLGRAIQLPERIDLDVKSPAEAIRAINVITNGRLEVYLRGPAKDRLYRIALQKRTNVIDTTEATNRSGRSAIYIMPTIRGRNSGFGKILAGVALIALAFINPLGAYAGFSTLTAVGSFTAAGALIAGFGVSLLLGGITQLLTPNPKGPDAPVDQRQSTSFAGNATAVVQGGCVPVVYGRALVAAVPVLISTSNNDVSVTDAGSAGSVNTRPLPGGGQQYDPGIDIPVSAMD